MVQRIPPSVQTGTWRRELARATRTAEELTAALGLDGAHLPAPGRTAEREFPVRVPPAFLARIERANPDDPLLRQVLPLAAEEREAEGFGTDPVGDLEAARAPGLLHKYRGRVLVMATGACPIHCRYCFRRHFPYGDHRPGVRDWTNVVEAIAADATIEEVILSGGDPLSLDDGTLADLAARLDAVPHLERLRIHSRFPVVVPSRVDEALLRWLGHGRLKRIVVIHANHPAEIGPEAAGALARIKNTGATLLNQAVLLRGVNDDAEILKRLSQRLFEAGVLPYYLHLLDRVKGAAHFEVEEAQARALLEALRAELPGYLVPKLVREIAGEPGKTPVA